MILRALNQPELIDAIERDELDVVISLIPDKLNPALGLEDIIELPLVLLVSRSSRIRSATDLLRRERITEPLIALGPNELICQRFQQALGKLGVCWLPRIEMDSLDLIERYVEVQYGVGLSVRVPGRAFSSKVRVLELPAFPSVRLGVLYRSESNSETRARSAFLAEVRKEAARWAATR